MQKMMKRMYGDLLYEKRKRKFGISQEDMAEKCCISIREYIDLENGKRLPHLKTFINIAVICDIDLNLFVKSLVDNGYKVIDEKNDVPKDDYFQQCWTK